MICEKILFRWLVTFAISTIMITSEKIIAEHSFIVDYEHDQFLMDGQPFRFIAGSFHYFRALPETWQRKLRTMRAAGLNTVTTYVEWSLHQPCNVDGVYLWEGIADLEKFIQLAKEEDLYVILRPGPYICAERDMGGFPYWILTKHPEIKLRTYDENYRNEVNTWFNVLLPKIVPYLYGNGGPIIMVQVENEYGSFNACDMQYRGWLRDLMHNYIKDKAVLFTTDGPFTIECGRIDGVFTTIDFGLTYDVQSFWNYLRKFQINGPLVNSEFYTGWLTHWQEDMARVTTESIIENLIEMLNQGASVNFYMFFGGTNFGFTSGANNGGEGKFNADTTSYDYDAPMDEAGDPTPKYMRIRETIGRYLPLPNISIPEPVPKKYYGSIKLISCCNILSEVGKNILTGGGSGNHDVLTFEELDTNSGLVLYETILPHFKRDPAKLYIKEVRDRAYIYIDGIYIGVLSRENEINTLPISPHSGTRLQILVENQGRINYNVFSDPKGILSEVLFDGEPLKDWIMLTYPFNNYYRIELFIRKSTRSSNLTLSSGPILFHGELYIEQDDLGDTYLDTTGWGKGIAFINGFNLGRYWPVVGPQITLYVPRELLRTGSNDIILFEYQMAPRSGEIIFSNVPMLDGVQVRARNVYNKKITHRHMHPVGIILYLLFFMLFLSYIFLKI